MIPYKPPLKRRENFSTSPLKLIISMVLLICGAYALGTLLCYPFSTPARFNPHVWHVLIGALVLAIYNRAEYYISYKKIDKINYSELKKMLNDMPRTDTAINERYGVVSEIEFCFIIALHHYCKQIIPKTGEVLTIYCHDDTLFNYEKRMYEKLFYKPAAEAEDVAYIPADWIFVMLRLINSTSLVPFYNITKERVLAEIDPSIIEIAKFPETVYESFWKDVSEKAHILDVIRKYS